MLRGQGPAVTAAGGCTRIMYAGQTRYEVIHKWSPHGRGVMLRVTLVDSKRRGRQAAKNTGYCEASEVVLSNLARKKADAITKGKRNAARKAGVPQGGGGGGCGADRVMSCADIAAIQGSQVGLRTCASANSTTRDTYLFVGANAGLEDRAATTRRGKDGSVPDVMEKDWTLAMGTDEGRVEETELTVKVARTCVLWSPAWKGGGAAGEESRNGGDGGEGGNGEGTGMGQGDDSGGVKRGGSKRKRDVRLTDPGYEKEEEKEKEKEEREKTWGDGSAGARRSGRARRPGALLELVEGYEEKKGRRRRKRRIGSRRIRRKKKKRRKRRG